MRPPRWECVLFILLSDAVFYALPFWSNGMLRFTADAGMDIINSAAHGYASVPAVYAGWRGDTLVE